MKKYLIFLLLAFSLISTTVDAKSFSRHFGGSHGFMHSHHIQKKKTYQTYTKPHPVTGKIYSGRTSGVLSPKENLIKRDRNHHRNQDGYGRAVLDKSSPNKDAIRGREQRLIDHHRANGVAADQINGISQKNPKRDHYFAEDAKNFTAP